ncbi:molybdenum cofactor guanylyltransferase [Candidatus Syntrophocurvum alkaliphilum]|nr:molybdenum cofactor guanylyltransferase [Candidatus Syntrophocurvum alkaliphilum]
MKYNKAFAKIDGKPIIEIIMAKFSNYFDETIIISNQPDLYKQLGVPIYTDIYPSKGPMSGIHSALVNATNDTIFTSACDMPFIDMDLVSYLINKKNNHDIVVPEINGYYQALSALYTKNCITVLENCLINEKLKLIKIYEQLNTLVVKEKNLLKHSKNNLEDVFLNINDEISLTRANKLAGRLLSSQ